MTTRLDQPRHQVARRGLVAAVVFMSIAVAGESNAASSRCDLVIGNWKWTKGNHVTFTAGGSANARGPTSMDAQGSWRCVNPASGRVEIKWAGGLLTTWVTPSSNGASMNGSNSLGETFTAFRMGAAPKMVAEVGQQADKGQRPTQPTRPPESKAPQQKARPDQQAESQRPEPTREIATVRADSVEITGLPLYLLSPAAKVEFDAGLAAAGREDWPDAIKRLTAAQQRSPAFPPILFNLGLANLAAGNEVPAIYWLEAYLATFPVDRDAAEQQIKIARANAETKMRSVLDAALQLGKEIGEPRQFNIALAYAGKLKDINSSMEALRKPDGSIDESDADSARWDYGEGLVAAREDVDGALSAVSVIKDPTKRDTLKSIISQTLLLSGNFDRASEIAAMMENPSERAYAQFDILIDSGSINESRVNELAALIEKSVGYKKTWMQGNLVRRLIYTDQIERARKLLDEMQGDEIATFHAYGSVAEYYLERDDEAAARALARRARDAASEAKDGARFGQYGPLLLLWLNGDAAEEAKRERNSAYYDDLVRYQASIGQLDKARTTLLHAARTLAGKPDWERHRQNAEGAISQGIDVRVRRFLGEGKLAEAKMLLRRHPREECRAAYLHVVEFDIGLDNLGDASATIETIPRGRAPLDLRDACVAERARGLIRLGRAQVTSGDTTGAAETVGKVANLIWRGALSVDIIEGVAALYDELGNDEGATWTRSILGFVPMRDEWIFRAQLASDNELLTQFAKRIQQIKLDGLKANTLSRLPADLAQAVSQLGGELHTYDVIKRRLGRRK